MKKEWKKKKLAGGIFGILEISGCTRKMMVHKAIAG